MSGLLAFPSWGELEIYFSGVGFGALLTLFLQAIFFGDGSKERE